MALQEWFTKYTTRTKTPCTLAQLCSRAWVALCFLCAEQGIARYSAFANSNVMAAVMATAAVRGENTTHDNQQPSSRILNVAVLTDQVATLVADLMDGKAQLQLKPQEASQLRELSLTLVAWDRMLYSFVVNRLHHAKVGVPPAGAALADAIARYVGFLCFPDDFSTAACAVYHAFQEICKLSSCPLEASTHYCIT